MNTEYLLNLVENLIEFFESGELLEDDYAQSLYDELVTLREALEEEEEF